MLFIYFYFLFVRCWVGLGWVGLCCAVMYWGGAARDCVRDVSSVLPYKTTVCCRVRAVLHVTEVPKHPPKKTQQPVCCGSLSVLGFTTKKPKLLKK